MRRFSTPLTPLRWPQRANFNFFGTADFASGRLSKATKPDLEVLAACIWPGRGPGLLLFGSGGTALRCLGY